MNSGACEKIMAPRTQRMRSRNFSSLAAVILRSFICRQLVGVVRIWRGGFGCRRGSGRGGGS